MTDDATLTDFVDSSGAADDPDGEDDESEPTAATSTYAWGEYVCEDCGSGVERVWRDGDDFVCPACKRW